jgi:multidrug resistance efflux pump
MLIILLITFLYCTFCWLVFFKFKWIKFSAGWGLVSAFFLLHLLLGIIVGLRFVTPSSANATVVQHTIQLIPRLPEPTLLTDVLVPQNVRVKRGQPLFQFDRRPYEYKVHQLEAEIRAAREKVAAMQFHVAAGEHKVRQLQSELVGAEHYAQILKTDAAEADAKTVKVSSELQYARIQSRRYLSLAEQGAGPAEDSQKWRAQAQAEEASLKEADAEANRARIKNDSKIGGVNTIVVNAEARLKEGQASLHEDEASLRESVAKVASLEAQLKQARYYLENTTMLASEDGRIVNLQVRPGMVAGILRIGGIAAFICDADRYLLATFYQENLKYVKVGQPAEVALELYPGQIFKGKVESIWMSNGQGQYIPSDVIPTFQPEDPKLPQGQFAVKITLEGQDGAKFPIGAHGSAAIYTSSHSLFVALRRIALRLTSWFYWLYPIPF